MQRPARALSRPERCPVQSRCLIHAAPWCTANDILDNEGPTGDSLGLSADELAFALQQIATEEFGATQSMANEISSGRMQAIMTRLLELREVWAVSVCPDWELAHSLIRWGGASEHNRFRHAGRCGR